MNRVLALKNAIEHIRFNTPPQFRFRLDSCKRRVDKSRPPPTPLTQEQKKEIEDEKYQDLATVQVCQDKKLVACRQRLYKLQQAHEQLKMEHEETVEHINNLNSAILMKKSYLTELNGLMLKKFGEGQKFQSKRAHLDHYLRTAQHQYAVVSGLLNVMNKWIEKIYSDLIHGPEKLKNLLKLSNRDLRQLLTYEELVKPDKPNEELYCMAQNKMIQDLEAKLEVARQEYEELKAKEQKAKNDLFAQKVKKVNLDYAFVSIQRKEKLKKAFEKLIFGVRAASHRIEQALEQLKEHEDRYSQIDAEVKELRKAAQPGASEEGEYCEQDERMKRPVMRTRAASAPEYEMPYTP